MVFFDQRAPSLPRAKTSITPLAGDVAAGDEVRIPPRDSHADHVVHPCSDLCQSAWSVPCTKTSRLFAFCASAAGPVPEASCPPRECQLDQEVPPFVVFFDQRAPSVPRAKTSITPLAGDVAAGD